MKRSKTGVSLIVLVITIIVMIILAGAVIISLNNTDIIQKTQDAVKESNLREVQYIASIAWTEAYLDNINETNSATRLENIKSAVRDALEKENIQTDEYKISITEKGVTVTLRENADQEPGNWRLQKTLNQEGTMVTTAHVINGTKSVEVGSVINYMPNGAGTTSYTGGWKLLGVDDRGRLLIISNNIDTVTQGGSSISEATTSYLNALTTLQSKVNGYNDGTIGISVRSVKAEDIDAITGFDKTTADGYGEEISYGWTGNDSRPIISGGALIQEHANGFIYYDVDTNQILKSDYVERNQEYITSLKGTQYGYWFGQYLSETSAAYQMINNNGDSYWLANRTILNATTNNVVSFMVQCVDYNWLTAAPYTFWSSGSWYTAEHGVRAVVTLAPDAGLVESTTKPGTYDIDLFQ